CGRPPNGGPGLASKANPRTAPSDMTRRFLALAFVLVVTASCAASSPTHTAGPSNATTAPRPSVPELLTPLASPSPSHAKSGLPGPLVVIVFENHSPSQILGNPCCPSLNAWASKGRIYANDHAITHPSLPNYLAMTSGSMCGKTGTDTVTPYCRRHNLWD